MGRIRKDIELKKKSISVSLDVEVFDGLDELGINKSQLINWLLKEYFVIVEEGGKNA